MCVGAERAVGLETARHKSVVSVVRLQRRASVTWSVGRRFGEALVAAVGRVNVGGSESTGSWRWSVGRRFGEAVWNAVWNMGRVWIQ